MHNLIRRWILLEGEGATDAPAGSATAAPSPAPTATPAPSPAPDPGLTPPESLLNDKPESTEKPEDGKKPEEPAKPEEPITYEAFKLPDGVTLDEAKLGDFTKLAAEARIPQDVAQKLVDLYSSDLKAIQDAPMRAWTEMQNKWQEQVRNDPEIGGKNLDKNLAATKTGLKNLLGEGADKFFEALNITGAGNNPEIIRGLFKAASAHAPASPVVGSPAGLNQKTAGATLYPGMAAPGKGNEG
jgi:hypothetical protein